MRQIRCQFMLATQESDVAQSEFVGIRECYAPVQTCGVTFNLTGIEVPMRAIHRLRSAVLAAGIGLAAIAPATANSIFLKLPNVVGPVTNSAFLGDIELSAYSQGFTDPATSVTGTGGGAGRGGGRTTCGAISIVKAVDSTSTDFLQYVTRGETIGSATIYFVGPGAPTAADVHYTIVLHNVRVTSITQGDTIGNTSGPGLTENISMIAETFEFTYRTVGADGAPGKVEKYGWDCATNRQITF